MDAPAVRFSSGWAEDLTLPDGRRVRLRLLRPDDKQALSAGFAGLSPRSRYLRFFTEKDRLTDAELRYLTEVDGRDHLAIALMFVHDDGSEGDGIGIARFVRLPAEPDVAEPAIAIVDAMHGKGLGRLMMLRLASAAAERGIRRFRCDFVATNTAVRELLEAIAPDVRFVSDGPLVSAEAWLPEVPHDHPHDEPPPPSGLARLLALVAEQALQLRRALEPDALAARFHALRDELMRRKPDGERP